MNFRNKVEEIVRKGSPEEDDLPALRGWVEKTPSSNPDDVELAIKALDLLTKHDDPRDLMLDLSNMIRRVGQDAAKDAWEKVGKNFKGPVWNMAAKFFNSSKGKN